MEIDISQIRKDYALKSLDEGDVAGSPFEQFKLWLQEAITSQLKEPTAFFLATSNKMNEPSGRVVLLKEVDDQGLVFFTNYQSRKGQEIAHNQKVAVTFWWDVLERQVRVEGVVEKLLQEESWAYHSSRPKLSQIGANASPQSQVIPNREYLEELFKQKEQEFKDSEVPLPENWGGYRIIPSYFEFWQGRRSRLHDRICYQQNNKEWQIIRLAP